MIIASFFFVNKLEAKLSLNSHEYTVTNLNLRQLYFATSRRNTGLQQLIFATKIEIIWKRNYQRQLSTDSRQEIFATTSLS